MLRKTFKLCVHALDESKFEAESKKTVLSSFKK